MPYIIDSTTYRSKAYNERPHGAQISSLIMHYTAENFAQSITSLTGQVSSHYLVPALSDPSYKKAGFTDLRIFNLVDEEKRAWHAGVSSWDNQSNLNNTSIGIEIVNLASESGGVFTFPDYEASQIEAIRELATNIMMRYPNIEPKNVVGHSDVAYMRKSDPGPKFPWKALAQAGIGVWYQEDRKQALEQQFNTQGMPSQLDIITTFTQYGYAKPDASKEAYKALVRAFQMHFRPENYDGVMDAETCACLYAVNESAQATYFIEP